MNESKTDCSINFEKIYRFVGSCDTTNYQERNAIKKAFLYYDYEIAFDGALAMNLVQKLKIYGVSK